MKSGHWLLGLAAISGALAPLPAMASEADLSVTLSLSSKNAIIAQGSSWNYKAVIDNVGPSHASGVSLNATLPSGLEFEGIVSGCSSHNKDGKLPCDVPDIIDGDSATVEFSVSWPLPKAKPDTCPSSLGDTDVAVSAKTTDAQPSNNTAALVHKVVPYADLVAEMSGPETASVGDVIEFTYTIKNDGPCDAEKVIFENNGSISGVPYVGKGLTFQSSTAPCENATDADTCSLNTMKKGDVITFKRSYRVESLPESLTSTGDPNGFDVDTKTFDPNTDDNGMAASAVTKTVVTSAPGCNASGVGSPAVVLALGGLLAFRRRFGRT